MGCEAKWEYLRVMYERYRRGNARGRLLDEFCLTAGYNRKDAISILAAVWEDAGYRWSVRLKALLPSWMHGFANATG